MFTHWGNTLGRIAVIHTAKCRKMELILQNMSVTGGLCARICAYQPPRTDALQKRGPSRADGVLSFPLPRAAPPGGKMRPRAQRIWKGFPFCQQNFIFRSAKSSETTPQRVKNTGVIWQCRRPSQTIFNRSAVFKHSKVPLPPQAENLPQRVRAREWQSFFYIYCEIIAAISLYGGKFSARKYQSARRNSHSISPNSGKPE